MSVICGDWGSQDLNVVKMEWKVNWSRVDWSKRHREELERQSHLEGPPRRWKISRQGNMVGDQSHLPHHNRWHPECILGKRATDEGLDWTGGILDLCRPEFLL